MTDALSFDLDDERFLAYQKAHPGATYAQYSAAEQADQIRKGYVHASLGPAIQNQTDWWQAGLPMWRLYNNLTTITPEKRLIEYGCGSLRVGAHFIKYLDSGNFMGLDVTPDFIDYGKEKLGAAMMTEKQPYLDIISKESLSIAETFQADLVYSPAVAFHVHPDDKNLYLYNLKRLTNKPGSICIFDTKLSSRAWRYRNSAWVRTAKFYIDKMYPLRLADLFHMRDSEEAGDRISTTVLVFRRD